MRSTTYHYDISAHLMPALMCGDLTGLTADEIMAVWDFEEGVERWARLAAGYRGHYWRCDPISEYRAECEVMGLEADCVSAMLVIEHG